MSEVKTLVLFTGSFTYTKEGKEGHGFNFVEFSKNTEGKIFAKQQTLFSNDVEVEKEIKPGDLVECSFQQSAFLNSKPKLIAIKQLKSGSEYFLF